MSIPAAGAVLRGRPTSVARPLSKLATYVRPESASPSAAPRSGTFSRSVRSERSGVSRLPSKSNTKTASSRRSETAATVPSRSPRSMPRPASTLEPSAISSARSRTALSERFEKTVATATAVTAAISAKASASHQRMPIRRRPMSPRSIADGTWNRASPEERCEGILGPASPTIQARQSLFVAMALVVAGRVTPTNVALLTAARALDMDAALLPVEEALRRSLPGDTVLARLDVRRSLDGVEPGFEQLDRLLERGVRLVNPPSALLAAHDKLQTAIRLAEAGGAHPRPAHVDDESPAPNLEFPVVVKPRFGSWGRDVVLCEDDRDLRRALSRLRRRQWFRKQGALAQELVPPRGYHLRARKAPQAVGYPRPGSSPRHPTGVRSGPDNIAPEPAREEAPGWPKSSRGRSATSQSSGTGARERR